MTDPGSRRWAPRRLASTALITVGSILLVSSGASVARGAIARESARARWVEIEAHRAALGARSRDGGVTDWTTARGSPIAQLLIPKLGLDEVVVEGVDDAALRAGPGHMVGSALPGDSGNAVLSAHRDRHFRSLDALAVGDTVVTDSERGRVVWRVTRIRVVDGDAPALRDSATPLLTLTTCWPIRYFGSAPDRLIVEARVVG